MMMHIQSPWSRRSPFILQYSVRIHSASGFIQRQDSFSMSEEKKKNRMWRWQMLCLGLLAGGVALIVLGLLMQHVIVPNVIETSIRENSRLIEGSQMMENWKAPKYKMQFKVWAYSIKNPDEMMNGEIPEMTHTGPYVFDRKLTHEVESAGNGVVKFRPNNVYTFNENDSCQTCILGNRVWIPNMIYQKFVEAGSTEGMKGAATTLLSQTPFLEVEVGELLFEGYKDPFLDKICDIPLMNFVCETILDLPERIGLFFEKNNTSEDVFEMLDGTERAEDLGTVVSWKGEPSVDETWWSTADARKIRGIEGSVFPPFIKKNQKLWIFITELCRSVWLEFQSEIVYKEVPAYRFIMPPDVFDPKFPGNKGFCNPNQKNIFPSQNNTECWPKGLLEISKCQRSQPPIVISLPNFLYAAKEVQESVKGLDNPEQRNDGIFVDIEPRTGVVLQAQRRSQVNIEMWKGKDLVFPVNLKRMRSSVLPVIAVNDAAEIDEETLGLLKTQLFVAEWWAYFAVHSIMVIGALMIIFALLVAGIKSHLSDRCIHMGRQTKHQVAPVPKYEPNHSDNNDSF